MLTIIVMITVILVLLVIAPRSLILWASHIQQQSDQLLPRRTTLPLC